MDDIFFGWLVPLFKGDKEEAIMFLITGFLAGIIGSFTFGLTTIGYRVFIALKYNRMYAKTLIEKGWEPASENDKQLLISNGVIMTNSNE
jgi:hypothetical protein